MENGTQTILFVDDEESILDISKEYFQQKSYNVVTARNGVEAMEALEKEKIDCCFTDINMPEMDGLELAENIRQKDNTIPVIIMTGYPSLENTIKTLSWYENLGHAARLLDVVRLYSKLDQQQQEAA